MPLLLHKLFLSLLIFSLLAHPFVIVLSADDLKDPSSSPDGGPANVVVVGDSSEWEDDSDAKPDDELDPGSWRPIFEPDSDSSEPKTEEEALYYSGVTRMISAVSSGDPRAMKEAASEIEAAAVGGNPHAQSVLGFLYQTGMMREWNRMKAFMYHCFAADGGNVQSRMALAYDYSRQDIYDKAAKLYAELAEIAVTTVVNSKVSTMIDPVRIHDGAEENKLALRRGGEEDEDFQMLEYQAQKGNADAMYKLGLFYYFGLRGLRCDHAKAFSWFLKAVEKGEPRSMELLGEIYARGAGVERNYAKALEWLKLASKQQICSAYSGMGYLYVRGFGVEKNYTKAKEYFEIAADNDDADGNYNLGVMYLKGIGVKEDVKQACKYFIAAANLGLPKAFYQLAKMFHTGVGLKKNLPMATALYKLVAEKGPWSSLSRWALEAYLKGDVGTAFLLYSRMAELGYEVAQSNAAWILDKYGNHSMCMGDSGFCTDAERHQREHSLWWQASKQGNEYASLLIRDAYHHGRGTERGYDHAPEAYTLCKSQSNATKGDECGLIEKV